MLNLYRQRELRFGQIEAAKGLFLYALNLVCGGWLAVLATVLYLRHTTYPWETLRSPALLAGTGALAFITLFALEWTGRDAGRSFRRLGEGLWRCLLA